MDLITRAHAAVRANNPRAALCALLEAWRQVPDPRLARAIDDLARLARGANVHGDRFDQASWQRVLDRRDPSEVGVLVANVLRPGGAASRERLDAVVNAGGPDPRIADALLRWLAAPPFSSHSSREFWIGVAAAIRACRDPRLVPAGLHAIGEGALARISAADGVVPLITDAVAMLRGDATLGRTLDAAEATALADFSAATAGWDSVARSNAETIAMFLERIRAEPDDDGERLVFADWLTEHGDPRGELISLGFARRDGRADVVALAREKQLVKQHTAEWLGKLAKRVPKNALRFERGFVDHVELDGSRNLPNLTGDPAWSTVESIGFTGSHDAHRIMRLLRESPMRALRRLSGITLEVVESLFALPIATQLTALVIVANYGDRDTVLAKITAGDFPNLREIDWTDAPTAALVRQLAQSPCEAIRLHGPMSKITIAIDRADATHWRLYFALPVPLREYGDLLELSRDPMFVSVVIDDGSEGDDEFSN
jgi:uncharacterized protein (TIGR02996 family)